MRQKPDILLLLSVLVISGVILSNFVVISHTDKNARQLSLLNDKYGQLTKIRIERDAERAKLRLRKLKTQQFVHID